MRVFLLIILLILFSFSISAQIYQGKIKDIQGIMSCKDNYQTSLLTDRVEEAAACFAEDAVIYLGEQKLEGVEAIEKSIQLFRGFTIIALEFVPSEIRVHKRWAHEWGTHSGAYSTDNGGEFGFSGQYIIIWKKEQKNWKIYRIIEEQIEAER